MDGLRAACGESASLAMEADGRLRVKRAREALAHYRELLRLNPGDNQGVRYLLVVALLERGHDDEAGALLDEYHDDIQALWPYARVLWRFRREGDTTGTRAALDEAAGANAQVIKYLLDPDSLPFERPRHFSLGSKDEAAYVAEELGAVYEATPGALDWLRSQAKSHRPRSRASKRPGRRAARRK